MSSDFFDKLLKDEKIVIVRALIYMVCSDAKIDSNERNFINEIIKIYDLNGNLDILKVKASEEVILNEIKEKITERGKSLYLIKELLVAANIDEILDNAEVFFIEKVAQVLNIEEEKVLQINELILERKLWLCKQSKIMEEGE